MPKHLIDHDDDRAVGPAGRPATSTAMMKNKVELYEEKDIYERPTNKALRWCNGVRFVLGQSSRRHGHSFVFDLLSLQYRMSRGSQAATV